MQHIAVIGYVTFMCSISVVISNQFDPHVFPKTGPFFEGWYLRIVDFERKNSYGLLFGHVVTSTSLKNSSDPKILASFLYRSNCTHNNNCVLNSASATCQPKDLNITVQNAPVVQNPNDRSPSMFKWSSPFGSFEQHINVTTFQFDFERYLFRGQIGAPDPWGSNGEGPEGWIDKLPFLPLHWFVFSLGSPVISYELIDRQTGLSVEGRNGLVHMEKNWGTSFPKGWIWSQGVSNSNKVSYALSGGLVSLGPIETTQYLFGYRNPSKNLILNFRPSNCIVTINHDGCAGNISLKVRALLHEVHLTASALASSFSKCLFGPEITGFRKACTESYDTMVNIVVFERRLNSLKVIDNQDINSSALEFGGTYTCNQKCKG